EYESQWPIGIPAYVRHAACSSPGQLRMHGTTNARTGSEFRGNLGAVLLLSVDWANPVAMLPGERCHAHCASRPPHRGHSTQTLWGHGTRDLLADGRAGGARP